MAYTTPRTWVATEKVTAALLNTHIRDNLNAAFPTEIAYADWTPTFGVFTLGNGTIDVARYIQIGDFVHGYLKVTLGSTSSMGTNPTFTLPVTASSSPSTDFPMGAVRLTDSGTANYWGNVTLASTTTGKLVAQSASGSYVAAVAVQATVPFTWTTGDSFRCEFRYEAA